MKFALLSALLLFSSASFASSGDTLLSCTARNKNNAVSSTDWNVTEGELDQTKVLNLENGSIELAVVSLFGTTAVTIKIDGQDDEVVPAWNKGRSVQMQLTDGTDVRITCYYQHDD